MTDGKSKEPKKVILVGSPNVGKSVIFGLLTGRYVTVSNYPGTPVEVSEGIIQTPGGGRENIKIIDSPGVNSLIPKSEDEQVTRNILLRSEDAGVLQVADTKNLKRALLINSQLADMGLPMVLVLNMYDEAEERGIHIDKDRLSMLLGICVIPTVATERRGLREIRKSLSDFRKPDRPSKFAPPIEKAIEELSIYLPETHLSKRFLSLTLLAGDTHLLRFIEEISPEIPTERVRRILMETQKAFKDPLGYVIQKQRQAFVDGIFNQCVSIRERRASSRRRRSPNPSRADGL